MNDLGKVDGESLILPKRAGLTRASATFPLPAPLHSFGTVPISNPDLGIPDVSYDLSHLSLVSPPIKVVIPQNLTCEINLKKHNLYLIAIQVSISIMRLPYVPDPPNFTSEDDKVVEQRVRKRRGEKGLIALDRTLLHAPPVADGW